MDKIILKFEGQFGKDIFFMPPNNYGWPGWLFEFEKDTWVTDRQTYPRKYSDKFYEDIPAKCKLVKRWSWSDGKCKVGILNGNQLEIHDTPFVDEDLIFLKEKIDMFNAKQKIEEMFGKGFRLFQYPDKWVWKKGNETDIDVSEEQKQIIKESEQYSYYVRSDCIIWDLKDVQRKENNS